MGYLTGADYTLITSRSALAGTSVLALHDRQDTNIPPAGGVSAFGWIYESLARAVGVYAAINGCTEVAHPALGLEAFEGGVANLQCTEHLNCTFTAPVRDTSAQMLTDSPQSVDNARTSRKGGDGGGGGGGGGGDDDGGGSVGLETFGRGSTQRSRDVSHPPPKARVVTCMYDGTHGVWPDQPNADQFIFWFFNRSKRGSHL